MTNRPNNSNGTPPDGAPFPEGSAVPDGAATPEQTDAKADPHRRSPQAPIAGRDASINTDIYRDVNRELPA
jgi:hypothetical protein